MKIKVREKELLDGNDPDPDGKAPQYRFARDFDLFPGKTGTPTGND